MATQEYSLRVGGKSIKGKTTDVYDDLNMSVEEFATLLSRDHYTPTLAAAPTATTTTYTDTELGVTATFRVGQLARVPSSDSDTGYTFYLCHHLTYGADGVTATGAVWQELGGAVDLSEHLTIQVNSNQSGADSALIGAAITVTDTDTNTALYSGTWQGDAITLTIPAKTNYKVTAGAVAGYATPAERTATAVISGARGITLTYQTCIVTVQMTGVNSGSSATATVAYGTTSVTVSHNDTVKIAYGQSVTVTPAALAGYTAPAAQTFTTDSAAKTVTLAYTYNPTYYTTIRIDQCITDPATMITVTEDTGAIAKIRANSHRYLGKLTAAGKMTVCQLSDTDSTKYADGSTATLTGSEGDVFMRLPRFWTKATNTATDVWTVRFAFGGKPADGGTWMEWGDNDLIGVYEAYNSSSKLYSRSGVTPTVSVSQANFKTYARARGTGFTIVKHRHQNLLAFLFYAYYQHTNAQEKVGLGTSSYPKTTGATNSLGMTDTVGGGNGDSQSINFWGLENWWGDIYEWEDNVVVDARKWTVTEDDGSTRSAGTSPSSDGYVSKLMIGDYLDTNPSAAGGSSTTGFCDYYYQSSSNSRVVLRSSVGSVTYGGVVCAGASSGSSYTNSGSGSRLAFVGEITEAASVAAYKAITAAG